MKDLILFKSFSAAYTADTRILILRTDFLILFFDEHNFNYITCFYM